MNDDLKILDMDCPKCGASDSRSQACTNIHCDDGMIDDHDEDPVNSPMGSFYTCPDCKGCGHLHWCSKCGYEFTDADFKG